MSLSDTLHTILRLNAKHHDGRLYVFPRSRSALMHDLAEYLEIQPMHISVALDALLDDGRVQEKYGKNGFYYKILETPQ